MLELIKKHRNALMLAASLILVLLVAQIFAGRDAKTMAYYFNEPSVSIGEIDLYAFYAVSNDREAYDYAEFSAKMATLVGRVDNFHTKQFLGKSKINYKPYPTTFLLENSSAYYDTEQTKRGNQEALKSVTLEIERRVFDREGDLYDKNFAKNDGAFRVIAIIYEGVGAAGTEGSFILSRDFVTQEQYVSTGATIFYHEFAHTLGVPEGYDINTNSPFTNDIMGSGRRLPIESNYLEQDTLKSMGVLN